jgi:FKBP-type peptidyl-prolyl cis-trans isomerase
MFSIHNFFISGLLRTIILLFISLNLFLSCQSREKKSEPDANDINSKLANINRERVLNESKIIDDFISEKKFKTVKTGTGLRYEIYQNGAGEHPTLNSLVKVSYQLYQLDGTLITKDTTVIINLGTGQEVKGLEEGILNMVSGDKAHLIVPSHLGYGMSGDGNKVPPSSSLYFNVELIEIIK